MIGPQECSFVREKIKWHHIGVGRVELEESIGVADSWALHRRFQFERIAAHLLLDNRKMAATTFLLLALVFANLLTGAFSFVPSSTASSSKTSPMHMTVPVDLVGQERLEKFLKDCELLGPVRLVLMNDGAILETVANFENLKFSNLSKGKYATVQTEDGDFECHLNMDKVAGIEMLTKPSKDETHELYIMRFRDSEGQTILSAMLHGKKGEYEEGAVAYWTGLKQAFGADQKIS